MSGKFSIAYLLSGQEDRSQKARSPISSSLQTDSFDTPSRSLRCCKVQLGNVQLWKKFHALGTEMIVTRSGRRMFPTLKYMIRGLDSAKSYTLMVDFISVDKSRYRYSFYQSKWMVAGSGEAELPSRVHVHADSPASGAHWCGQAVEFTRIKLTNNQLDRNGHIIVNSMHRYVPRLHVVEHVTEGGKSEMPSTTHSAQQSNRRRTFNFPETEFMAVTAYQNHRITELKIHSNPFARGFRESELDSLRRTSIGVASSPPLLLIPSKKRREED